MAPLLITATILLALVPASARADLVVYGLKSFGPNGTAPTNLFSFDVTGGGVTNHGEVTLSGSSINGDGLALSPIHGLLGYDLSTTGSTLINIDTGSVTSTTIGTELAGREIRGAGFDLQDRFWAIDSQANELIQVNPTNGSVIGSSVGLTVGGNAFDVSTRTDIAIRGDGTFFSSARMNSIRLTSPLEF